MLDINLQLLTLFFIGFTFVAYIVIAFVLRQPGANINNFYVANRRIPAFPNGAATAADWMSASSFISVAGIISFWGFDGMALLLGWTGGFVLLTLLVAPYLRRYAGFTVAGFLGDRFDSKLVRLIAAIFAIAISFIYIIGQMKGVGVIVSNIFPILPSSLGVIIGMVVILTYVAISGMQGITQIQVVQGFLVVIAYIALAGTLSSQLGFNPIPQLALGDAVERLHGIQQGLGFPPYTQPFTHISSIWDRFFILVTLMCGTAGLPHIIIRFYTARSVNAARWSGFYALLFIGIVYTAMPTMAVISRGNIFQAIENNKIYDNASDKFKNFLEGENKGSLLEWEDKNDDRIIQHICTANNYKTFGGVKNKVCDNPNQANEVTITPDDVMFANFKLLEIPSWVIILVFVGASAAVLSTVSILLFVMVSSVSHDIIRISPFFSKKNELLVAKLIALTFIIATAYVGILWGDKPISEVVAIAFSLACAGLFPAIILGIFDARMNKQGAMWGMISGFAFTAIYSKPYTFNSL